jgi:hypothetical protein
MLLSESDMKQNRKRKSKGKNRIGQAKLDHINNTHVNDDENAWCK